MYIGEINMSPDADVSFMFDKARTPVVAPSESDHEENDGIAEVVENVSVQTSHNYFCNFSSTELDGIVYNLNSATTQANMGIAYKNLSDYFKANAVQIPLFFSNEAIFVNSRIKGKIKTNLTNFYADFGELYIETEK